MAIIADVPVVSGQKQPTAKEIAITKLVDSQQYVFYAQYVIPSNGRQRNLTSDYTVSVSKDTVTSDLPFFGRAYSAPINPGDGGIKFTSTNFSYKLEQRKKGGWIVTIKAPDAPGVQQLNMTIFENGTASLLVTSTSRQPISFNGYIRGRK